MRSLHGTRIDRSSHAYRYPVDKKGQPSTKRNQEITLGTLATRMAAVLEDLDTVHFGLNIETDKAEELYSLLSESFHPGM